jgi:hypothetical protein
MDELIIVSVDGHAQMPPELWPEYLESRHHHLLPGLHEDQQRYAEVMQLIFDRAYPDFEVFDGEGIYRAGGWRGLYDTDIRMSEMDREGVAGEFVNTGDGRFVALFFEPSSRAVSAEACRAGVRAYHRWAHEVLGDHTDRLFLIGSVGHAPCMDLEPALAELDWIADHGFRATTLPGKTAYPGDLPLPTLTGSRSGHAAPTGASPSGSTAATGSARRRWPRRSPAPTSSTRRRVATPSGSGRSWSRRCSTASCSRARHLARRCGRSCSAGCSTATPTCA